MVKRPSVNISHKSLLLPQLSTNFGSVSMPQIWLYSDPAHIISLLIIIINTDCLNYNNK